MTHTMRCFVELETGEYIFIFGYNGFTLYPVKAVQITYSDHHA